MRGQEGSNRDLVYAKIEFLFSHDFEVRGKTTKKSTFQQQSSPNGRTRMGPKSDTGYGMENVGLFDENSELC